MHCAFHAVCNRQQDSLQRSQLRPNGRIPTNKRYGKNDIKSGIPANSQKSKRDVVLEQADTSASRKTKNDFSWIVCSVGGETPQSSRSRHPPSREQKYSAPSFRNTRQQAEGQLVPNREAPLISAITSGSSQIVNQPRRFENSGQISDSFDHRQFTRVGAADCREVGNGRRQENRDSLSDRTV